MSLLDYTLTTKSDFRRQAKKLRQALPLSDRSDYDREISKNLTSLPFFKNIKHIGLFASFDTEVDTRFIFDKATDLGISVYYPKVVNNNRMDFYRVCSLAELTAGYKGILEPVLNEQNKIEPHVIDLMVIPGLAFDVNCSRIGYGGGFYDRYLAHEGCNCLKIALCYDMQIFDTIPVDVKDVKMDIIVSEKRIIYCNGYQKD